MEGRFGAEQSHNWKAEIDVRRSYEEEAGKHLIDACTSMARG